MISERSFLSQAFLELQELIEVCPEIKDDFMLLLTDILGVKQCRSKSLIYLRNRAILCTLLYTGISVTQMCGLNIEDVEFIYDKTGLHGVLTIKDPNEIIRIPEQLCFRLLEWFQIRPNLESENALFLNNVDRRIYYHQSSGYEERSDGELETTQLRRKSQFKEFILGDQIQVFVQGKQFGTGRFISASNEVLIWIDSTNQMHYQAISSSLSIARIK